MCSGNWTFVAMMAVSGIGSKNECKRDVKEPMGDNSRVMSTKAQLLLLQRHQWETSMSKKDAGEASRMPLLVGGDDDREKATVPIVKTTVAWPLVEKVFPF